jgi:1,4-dihydroxy-6-naphthoate synthase
MPAARPLTIALTDDREACSLDALGLGRLALPGFRATFRRGPLGALNRAALRGLHDVTAISSIVYPQVADRYAILSAGTTVSRGRGPVLASKGERKLSQLRGRRVGVGGIPTTGWFLLSRFCPGAIAVEMPFGEIAPAVAAGELDAAVIPHEELPSPPTGLRQVVDLGAAWHLLHGLPLPLGLTVVRRGLGLPAMWRICAAIRASSLPRAVRFGRGRRGADTDQRSASLAHLDSLRMADDVRAALGLLFRQTIEARLGGSLPPLDVVEGAETGATPAEAA